MDKKEKDSMEIFIHQTHHKIADFDKILTYVQEKINVTDKGIHIFPELFLTGYPLQDLCLQKPFITTYEQFLSEIKLWIKNNINHNDICILMGGLDYDLSEHGIPKTIENVVFKSNSNDGLTPIYTKQLLPNYDIFDEKKYFKRGEENCIIDIFGKKIGVLICEDMWPSTFHDLDPVQNLSKASKKQKIELDAVINLSASPYILGKSDKRVTRAMEISNSFKAPFYYCNRVGAEDEILFDGQSFVVNADEIEINGKRFIPEILKTTLVEKTKYKKAKLKDEELTWESLFSAKLDLSTVPPKLIPWSDTDCQEILEALVFAFREYSQKNGFDKFTIALSGGMDSALVLTIIRLALTEKQKLEAIYMPSIHSSTLSFELSMQLCKKLGIPMKSLPIKFLHSTAKNLFGQTFPEPFEGLTDENVQSRLRGLLLYTRSNQFGSMVVNTSNKSELAVGYSTQYGDSVGAISLLGDLYKSQVYRLSEYINKAYSDLIPEEIITREPTAELKDGQVDSDSLPQYDVLDAILECILNYRYNEKDLLEMGFNAQEVEKTIHMYKRNEYKRYQFCPIVKVSSKSFGFGYRIPLSKDTKFYNK
jgi:NAD+ synthase (glutamine-hydrolysing)